MKKLLFTVALCGAMFTLSHAQDAKPAADPNAPEIKFETTVHDFGTIEFNGKAECEFVFTNVGKSPLIIDNCRASCGCTAPTCPKGQPIKPGEKGSVKVVYKNTNYASSFSKTVTVESNAKTKSVPLVIKGTVAPQVKKADK